VRTILLLIALLTAPTAHAQTLSDLAWLTGCWRTAAPAEAESGASVTEVWIAPPMPAMLGYAYTVGEGQTQGWEQTRIEMIEGWPHFVAMPNGGAPVRFRLRETDGPEPGRAQFENAQNDYPQVVEYRRDGDALYAAISDLEGGNRIQFVYHAISCEGALAP
jgi:hypothetical protein